MIVFIHRFIHCLGFVLFNSILTIPASICGHIFLSLSLFCALWNAIACHILQVLTLSSYLQIDLVLVGISCSHSQIHTKTRITSLYIHLFTFFFLSLLPFCRDGRIRIDNTRLFLPPPTITLMTSDVVVNQLVLFTMLQSFFRIPEE